MIAELQIPNIAFMVDSGLSMATRWLQVNFADARP
jgi:hypothetical protein